MPFLSRVPINPMSGAGREALRNPHVAHGMVVQGVAGVPEVPDVPEAAQVPETVHVPGSAARERVLWRLDTDGADNATFSRWPELLILTRSRPDWSHIVEQAGWPDADGGQVAVRDYEPLLTRLAVGREFAFRITASPVQNTHAPDKLMPGQERRRDGGSERGLRLAHRTASHQLEWLIQRAPRWGFEIPAARGGPSPGPWLPPLYPALSGAPPSSSGPPSSGPPSSGPPSFGPPSLDPPTDEWSPHSPGAANSGPPSGGSSFGPPSSEASEPRDVRISARQVYRFRKGKEGRRVVLRVATFDGRLRVTDPDLLREKLLQGVGPAKAYGCGLLTLAPLPG